MMSSAPRELIATINGVRVGTLSENNDLWAFDYHDEWLLSPDSFPLIPALPLQADAHVDTGSSRPVQWFFDNLLPEAGARDVIASSSKVSVDDAFSLLHAVGAESAGAITLLSPDEVMPEGAIERLSDAELQHRIDELPSSPLNKTGGKRMSLAGAQHKMLVVIDQGRLYEPVGQTTSTHIVKPEHTDPERYWQTVRNEWFLMTLAKKCGLEVPEVSVRYLPAPIYLVERFDRVGNFPNQRRLHVIDACQLLNLAAYSKYNMSTAATLKSVIDLCRAKAQTTLRIFRWALFNFLTGNGDAHLKNLSFSYADSGVKLMPHYDLVSTAIYEPTGKHLETELSQPMGKASEYGRVGISDVLSFAEELGLSGDVAKREAQRLVSAVKGHSDELLRELKSSGVYKNNAGEERMLNSIKVLCIDEFSANIG